MANKLFYKKIFLTFSAVVLFISPIFVLAEEKINNFSVFLFLNKDGSINVSESILYDFGATQHHGIFRDIPVRDRSNFTKHSIRMSDISVVDENGAPYSFTLSNYRDHKESDYKRIKIGDSNKLVRGVKKYTIRYTVRRAIGYFDNFDEIYWNATGNNWTVPISNISVIVSLPSDVKKEQVKFSCYRGVFGYPTPCEQSNSFNGDLREKYNEVSVSQVGFFENKLSLGEGLTVAVGFPKGILQQPSWVEGLLWFLRDNYILALPFFVFGLMFWLWYKKGRDPKGKSVIIAEYEPPPGITPILAGTLIDEKVHNHDITADIIYLAEQGFLKIRKIEKSWFLGKSDYELELLKDFFSLSSNLEFTILEVIFGARAPVGANKKLSELRKNKNFAKEVRNIKKMVIINLIDLGLMDKNSNFLKWSAKLIAGIIGIIVIIYSRIVMNLAMFYSTLASIVIVIIFSRFMDKKTKLGVETRNHILGFKEFLSVTEKDRLDFHNAPEKTPEQFMKYLPYAIALDVEKKWAAQFSDIYISPPNWYEGNLTGAVFVHQLANDLSGFTGAVDSGFSAASRVSGSGGGGFSGGGGGGGGGGSW